MKAFLVGLLFLIGAIILIACSVLFLPLVIAMGIAFQAALVICLACFAIWLLGRLILWIWEEIKK